MQQGRCCIHVLYSTLEFDVILGRVMEIDARHKDIHVNDIVYLYVDWNEFYIDTSDMLYSLIVNVDNVFKIKKRNTVFQ
jgi:hypothetical protein